MGDQANTWSSKLMAQPKGVAVSLEDPILGNGYMGFFSFVMITIYLLLLRENSMNASKLYKALMFLRVK